MKYLAILLIFLLNSASADENSYCVGNHKYENMEIVVMNSKYFGYFTGYQTSRQPKENEIAWTLSDPKGHDGGKYKYNYEEFLEILLKTKKINESRHEKWDAMYVNYTYGGHTCVMAIPFDKENIYKNFGAGEDEVFTIYVNGAPYAIIGNPYPIFYEGLATAGFIDPELITYHNSK